MNDILNLNTLVVKEHTGVFKAANEYDIYDPNTKSIVLNCREDDLGFLTKLLRFTNFKTSTPFDVKIKDLTGKNLIRVTRGPNFFYPKIFIRDERDRIIGKFKIHMVSTDGIAFDVLNQMDQPKYVVKGRYQGWDFRFTSQGKEYAHITKRMDGTARHLFTSADNYGVNISDSVPANDPVRKLILAAVIYIDMGSHE